MDYSKISLDERTIMDAQRKAYTELREIARNQSARFESSLHWQEIKGTEYLIKTKGQERRALGTRAPHMEEFYKKYNKSKKELLAKIVALRHKIDEGRNHINHTMIRRVPLDSAMVLRKLEKEGYLGDNFVVSGLQCIYAYEAQGNVRFKQTLHDRDIYNISKATEKSLVLLGSNGDEKKLFESLLQIDSTYKIIGNKGRYRATNKNGFNVDLVCTTQNSASNWMLSVPRIETVSFCESGLPVPFVCLAPHVFALYKYWQSQNYQDKLQQTKAEIDSKQAYAITDMVKQELGTCITEEDYTAVPACITNYKEQLASETEEQFGRTYEI